MITRVLVPLDGSPQAEQAIPYAQALLPDGGSGVCLRVLPELDPFLSDLPWTHASAPAPAETAAVQAELERVVSRIADSGSCWTTEVVNGDPATEIIKAISRHEIDVVAMTTHGRGALGRAVFGSVADRVTRESPVPVLLIRPRTEAVPLAKVAVRRLVVPLDGSALAEAALPLAVELARRLQVAINLVRAINPAAFLAPLADGGMLTVPPSPELYEDLVEGMERDARAYLTSVAARLTAEGIEATWAVLTGSPYVVIAEATTPGDLLVMTSHGRSGVLRWLLGSVAEKLVREAPVPVVLVPANGRGTKAVAS